MSEYAGKSKANKRIADSSYTPQQRNAVQLVDNRPRTLVQKKQQEAMDNSPRVQQFKAYQQMADNYTSGIAQRKEGSGNKSSQTIQKKGNNTGLPDNLKTGVENLSGLSMDDVKVHYNSAQPAQLQALAYAQGSDIHVGPGQEKHLPHEAWHVVQQKQGRVKATAQMKGGVNVNNDAALEHEADVMGAKAIQTKGTAESSTAEMIPGNITGNTPIQRKVGFEFETHWDITKPAAVKWNTNSKLAEGNGWQLSPDEIEGNNAKIEFKTKPYEVDGDNTEALIADISTSMGDLKSYGDRLVALDAKGPLPGAPATFAAVEVTPQEDDLAAKPQVTGGVRTDLIIKLLDDATKEKGETKGAELMPDAGRKDPMKASLAITKPKLDENSKASREYAGNVSLLSYYIRRAYQRNDQMKSDLGIWIKQYLKQINDAPTEIAKETLRNNYMASKTEWVKNYAPTYAKAIASLLPRVRFSKFPGINSPTLLKDVLEAAGMGESDKGKQTWPTGLKVFAGDWKTVNETIEEWITNIQAEDPSQPLTDDDDFWGEREIEAGEVGHGDKKGSGILIELRGINGGLTYDKYFSFVKPYIDYFRTLNQKDKPPNA